MRNTRGITPIISVILLLMMTVAVAGLAWVWLQGMTTNVMGTTENMTQTQMKQMLTIIDLADYTVGCNSTGQAVNLTLQVFNRGSSEVNVNNVLVNGRNRQATAKIGAGSIGSITVGDATNKIINDIPGLTNATTKSADIMISASEGYAKKTVAINGGRCNP